MNCSKPIQSFENIRIISGVSCKETKDSQVSHKPSLFGQESIQGYNLLTSAKQLIDTIFISNEEVDIIRVILQSKQYASLNRGDCDQ